MTESDSDLARRVVDDVLQNGRVSGWPEDEEGNIEGDCVFIAIAKAAILAERKRWTDSATTT